MSSEPDRQYFSTLASSVLRSLQMRQNLGEFTIRMGAVKTEATDTDGWKSALGNLTSPNLSFEIWHDRFQGGNERKIWFGVSANDPKSLKQVGSMLREQFYMARNIGEAEIIYDRIRGHYRLRHRTESLAFDRPISEHYRNHLLYFGYYITEVPPPNSHWYRKLVSRIAEFFVATAQVFAMREPDHRARRQPQHSAFVFNERFKRFQDAVRANSGKEFRSFFEGLPKEWEGYKEYIYQEGRRRLNWQTWKRKEIGTGKILNKVVQAIEIEERGPAVRNNLVAWSNRYGPRGISHRALLDARTDRERCREFEQILFMLYRGGIEEAEAFERLCGIAGRRYDLIAYLFFLKDWERFMPIATVSFDQAFRLLRFDLQTSKQCSWRNYKHYNYVLREVQWLLRREARIREVRLIDAHSFCWMLARLQIPDNGPSLRIPVIEPLGRVAILPDNRASLDARAGTDGNVVDFEKLAKQRQEIGRMSEVIVIDAERERLRQAGCFDLAKRVESKSENHGLGYDVLSFDEDGAPRQIEVKTAQCISGKISFHLTENERKKSRTLPNYYYYLVFRPRSKSRKVKWLRPSQIQKGFLKPIVHYVEFVAEAANIS